jgi:branched-chain amino acid transport system substrate-binding protein
VREGNTRGLFKDRKVVSFLTGEPEYLDPLKEETPEGWIVTGYPWYSIKSPEHDAFLKAYQAKYNDYPRLGSIVGYQTIKSAAAILAKANSTDPEKLIAAAEGLSVPSPFGEITFRKIDHQSTLGAYVGKTAVKDGKGVMVDSVYRKGSDYLPSDAEVEKLRPKECGSGQVHDRVSDRLMVRDARLCRAPHHEGRVCPLILRSRRAASRRMRPR